MYQWFVSSQSSPSYSAMTQSSSAIDVLRGTVEQCNICAPESWSHDWICATCPFPLGHTVSTTIVGEEAHVAMALAAESGDGSSMLVGAS